MYAKKHLDLDQVVQVAVALADQDGLEAITLAGVADKLGIRIPSVYHYVAGLDGLHHQIAVWGVSQLRDQLRRVTVGKAKDDAILAFANAYRTFAHTHPGAYASTLRAPRQDEPDLAAIAQETVEMILAVLEPYGFKDDDALHQVRALRSVLHGFVALEAAGGFGLPLDCDESFRRLIHMLIQGLHK